MSQAGQISLTSQSLNHIYLPTPTETQSMNKNAQDKYLGCNPATKSQESYIYIYIFMLKLVPFLPKLCT